MTNEKMLEMAYSAKAGLINPYDIKMCEFMEKVTEEEAERYNKTNYDAAAKIGYMINCLKHDIAKEADKKTVNGSAVKVIEKYIKKHKNDIKPVTHATKVIDGKQYYCDGYLLFKLDNLTESLPVDDKIDCDYVGMLRRTEENSCIEARLTLPTPQELKAKIAIDKAEWKAKQNKEKFLSVYDFGDGKPLVNTEFLLDVLTVTGADTRAYAKEEQTIIYFVSDTTGNEALLCPLNKKYYYEKQKEN